MPQNNPTKPLSIIMLIDAWFPFWGGGQVHVDNLSKQLVKRGHQVKIFYPSNHSIVARLIWTFFSPLKIYLYVLSHQADLIHSHGFSPGVSAKFASLLTKLPVVHTVHGSHLMDIKGSDLKTILEKFFLTQIKYNFQITVSRNFLNYPNINKSIKYIANGINLSDFDQINSSKYKTPTILFVGRNHPDKGIVFLKKADKILRKKNLNFRIKFITNGKIVGKNLFNVFKKSSIFVLPSRAEGQAITILEAWAAKIPVITTRVGDNPYLIKNKHNGMLVDYGNPHQLADTIALLLNKPKLSSKIATNGYNTVKKDHQWHHIAKQTVSIYRQALQQE